MDLNLLKNIQGVWKSRGYGTVLEIKEDQFRVFDHCAAGCLEVGSGELGLIANQYSDVEKVNDDQFIIYPKGAVTKYYFDRISKVPDVVKEADKNNPVLNFEYFWNVFNENYAFFDLRKTNWKDIYNEYRPKVSESTTDAELTEIFRSILHKLGDMHVSMKCGDVELESAKPTRLHQYWRTELQAASRREFYEIGMKKMWDFVCKQILKGSYKKGAGDLLYWGKLENNIGYLYIGGMYGFAGMEEEDPDVHIKLLSDTMDVVMADLKDCAGMVVDARFNHGGYDAASRTIASRFTDKKRVGFYKQAIYGNGRTEQQPIDLDPSGDFQFTKPVVLLTSDTTISAAEIFTLFMMSIPHVTRMGEPTQGVLSDVLGKQLPNGWRLGLSNEIYTAIDNVVYESVGIPVNIPAPVYDQSRFYDRIAELVDEAAAYALKKA